MFSILGVTVHGFLIWLSLCILCHPVLFYRYPLSTSIEGEGSTVGHFSSFQSCLIAFSTRVSFSQQFACEFFARFCQFSSILAAASIRQVICALYMVVVLSFKCSSCHQGCTFFVWWKDWKVILKRRWPSFDPCVSSRPTLDHSFISLRVLTREFNSELIECSKSISRAQHLFPLLV